MQNNMQKTVYAVMIIVAGTFAGFAQAPGDPSQRGSIVSTVPPDVVKDLAPTGKLRAAINLSNIVLVQKDPATGAPVAGSF